MKKRRKILLIIFLILAFVQLVILGYLFYLNLPGSQKIDFGVTFSPSQAKYLGVEPEKVLEASLNDLNIKKYRISAYWNVVEKQLGVFDFSDIDWQINMIEKANGEIILAIGRRLPRWPECHDPEWLGNLSEQKVQQKTLALLEKTIEKYKNRNSIVAWQVENEPLLSIFGECPKPDKNFYKSEVDLVRKLDPTRPIVVTESGELSTWLNGAIYGDMVGISVYRTTWDKIFGFFYYPLTPSYYKHKARMLTPLVKNIFVSELQAEPWERTPLPETPLLEQKFFMNPDKLDQSVDFVRRAGFNDVYLWGVEWWYWLLDKQNDPSMWLKVKELVKNK